MSHTENTMQNNNPEQTSETGAQALANLPAQDATFVQEAATGNTGEIVLGQLASERAENNAVRGFGETMITDHTTAGQELIQILVQEHIPVPQGLDTEHLHTFETLSGLSRSEFDTAYIQNQVEDHQTDIAQSDIAQTDIARYTTEAEQGQDAALRQFAAETIPLLQHHLQLAEGIQHSTLDVPSQPETTTVAEANAGAEANNGAEAASQQTASAGEASSGGEQSANIGSGSDPADPPVGHAFDAHFEALNHHFDVA